MKFIIKIEKDGRYLVRRAGFWGWMEATSCGLSNQIVPALMSKGMPISEFEKEYLS